MELSANVRKLLENKSVFTKKDLLNELSDRIEGGETQRSMAFSLGISGAYLSDVLRGARGKRILSDELAGRLGYEVVTIYLRKA